MSKPLIFITFLTVIFLTACDPRMIYDKFKSTGDGSWSWEEKIIFDVDIEDTISAFNVFVNIRHNKEYPFSNLYVFLSLKGPTGGVINDTLEFRIAEPSGKWTGTGFGNVKLVRKIYREGIHFARKGTYTFEVEQGMRKEEIPVTDVGIRVEKYSKLK